MKQTLWKIAAVLVCVALAAVVSNDPNRMHLPSDDGPKKIASASPKPAPDFAVFAAPTQITLHPTESAPAKTMVMLQIDSLNGFRGPISLRARSRRDFEDWGALPAGLHVTFPEPTVALNHDGHVFAKALVSGEGQAGRLREFGRQYPHAERRAQVHDL